MRQNEIRLSNIYDGEIKKNPEFQAWAESVGCYLCESLGPAPTLRVGAYRFGATVGVAIDFFVRGSDEQCLTITAILSEADVLLPQVRACAGQLDIVLPGVLDALHLVDILQKRTGGRIDVITM